MPVAGAVMLSKFTIKCLSRKAKNGPKSICPEFMILGYSLKSHAANMISDFHFSEALFMAKSFLEPCTTLNVAGLCLGKSL